MLQGARARPSRPGALCCKLLRLCISLQSRVIILHSLAKKGGVAPNPALLAALADSIDAAAPALTVVDVTHYFWSLSAFSTLMTCFFKTFLLMLPPLRDQALCMLFWCGFSTGCYGGPAFIETLY